jgi:hypothetical protein
MTTTRWAEDVEAGVVRAEALGPAAASGGSEAVAELEREHEALLELLAALIERGDGDRAARICAAL